MLVYIVPRRPDTAIYNEVLQFFLIVFGFLPLSLLGLKAVGWWPGLQAKLAGVATARGFEPSALTESWSHLGSASANPMGVEWFGLAMGLGVVLSFGYWCTDFLVVQRAMAAKSMNAARRTPIIAAIPKMVFPFLVVVPGMVIIALVGDAGLADASGQADYNRALPLLLGRLYPSGLLGLGLAALLASFMSGMAGNVTAFNRRSGRTTSTRRVHPPGRRRCALHDGPVTVFGTVASIATAYIAMTFDNIMDLLQLVFSFINAPLFATFLLGMFWASANGAFWGLLAGTGAAAVHYVLTGVTGGRIGFLHAYPSDMAQNFWGAIFAFFACLLCTIGVSFVTRPRKSSELVGLVFTHAQGARGRAGVVSEASAAGPYRPGGGRRTEHLLPVAGRGSRPLTTGHCDKRDACPTGHPPPLALGELRRGKLTTGNGSCSSIFVFPSACCSWRWARCSWSSAW